MRAWVGQGAKAPDVWLAVAVIGVLIVMMVPVPSWLMDVLLATNLSLGVLILLSAIYMLRPLDFSVFPSLLLLTTLFRLALNVASTRLILLHGQEGPSAAGHVIEGFGQFVVGGNTVVGLVIFLILVVINFVVITKGSTRIAEVAARFTLDAMPGKQMAIDADLNAGLIDDKEAQRRREAIAREAEFYGAMDGAAKFVRGDAVAGLVITAINLVGGLLIGVFQHGMSLGEATRVFSILTVGDGLVSQIPALVISTAAGIVITRASGEQGLPAEVFRQLTMHPRAHWVAAGALLLVGLAPGMPFVPFVLLSLGFGLLGQALRARRAEERVREQEEETTETPVPTPTLEEELAELLVVDPLRIEIGYGLIDLASRSSGLLERIQGLRRRIAQELGYLLPAVHVKDNLRLHANAYRILIRSAEVARGEVQPNKLLALDGEQAPGLEGTPTREPAFGLPALWIDPGARAQAERAGCTVVDPATVIITHLSEVLRTHLSELIDRDQVQRMLDKLAEQHPKVVEEIVPAQVSLGQVQRVLQRLLEEGVPIHDLLRILETIADAASQRLGEDEIVERVRARLGRALVQRFLDAQGRLRAFVLDGALEREIAEGLARTQGEGLPIPIERWQAVARELQEAANAADLDEPPLIVAPQIRPWLARLMRKAGVRVAVLSSEEIPAGVGVETLAVIRGR
ncbi:MAG: flagellar biosynthesis protein FlhA [Zetaproteobacteria bacterium]|nr:MAG: flagellar biosynthesis protein FlhA [Zetaproteobacteria bacterium]